MYIYPVFVLELSQRFPGQRLGHLIHQFIPGDRFFTVVDADHGDTALDRADDEAEAATDAIFFPDLRLFDRLDMPVDPFVLRNEVDALVCAVLASDITEIALDTL